MRPKFQSNNRVEERKGTVFPISKTPCWRSTVREAVKLLISRGILEVRRGSGTYVVGTTPSDMDPLGLRHLEDKMSFALDLADVRILSEPGIAECDSVGAKTSDDFCQ